MCGRYSVESSLILPGTAAPVLMAPEGYKVRRTMRWGLAPAWSQGPLPGRPLINARAETLAQRPIFREAFRRRRCLVPAEAFFERRGAPGRRRSFLRCALKGGGPFSMAGLWDEGEGPEVGPLPGFVVITTEANGRLRPFHPRMPVVLHPGDEALWLDPAMTDTGRLTRLFVPFPGEGLSVEEEGQEGVLEFAWARAGSP